MYIQILHNMYVYRNFYVILSWVKYNEPYSTYPPPLRSRNQFCLQVRAAQSYSCHM